MNPDFQIIVGSDDITEKIKNNFISLAITDRSGIESDTAVIALQDNGIALPRSGALLEIAMGYAQTGIATMGAYVVDEIELSGPPDSMIIYAKAADFTIPALKSTRTRTFNSMASASSSVGAGAAVAAITALGSVAPKIPLTYVIETIAAECGLIPVIDSQFRAVEYQHVQQTAESNIHLLTRLAIDLDAVAKPQNGRLIFAKKGNGLSGNDRAITPVMLIRSDVDSWSIKISERGKFASVQARYRDVGAAQEVMVMAGTGEPSFTVRKIYHDEREALGAANARLESFARGTAQATLKMPGDNRVMAEAPLTMRGFRDGVDGAWVIDDVVHTIDSEGYACSVSAVSLL